MPGDASPGANPDTDTPVEALIRHNIEVYDSAQARLLRNLMMVLMVAFGAAFLTGGGWLLTQDDSLLFAVLLLVTGAFLVVWGPYSRRQILADQARKAAAAQWQLEQVKAARLREGRGLR